jgi:hypothetical protein
MDQEQYYAAPAQAVFDDIKQAAIKVWGEYDDTYGYASEKINYIKDIQNVKDNAWFIVAMFDHINKVRLLGHVSDATREILLDVMKGV